MNEILVTNRRPPTFAQLFLGRDEQTTVNGAWDLEVQRDEGRFDNAPFQSGEPTGIQIRRILTHPDRVPEWTGN